LANTTLDLTSAQRQLLQIIFDAFKQNEDWPRYQYVDSKLYYDHGIKTQKALEGLPDGLTNLTGIPAGHAASELEVTITIGGVYPCSGAESDVALFWRLFSQCVEMERQFRPLPTSTDRPVVKSAGLEAEWGADHDALSRLHKLLAFEPWALGRGKFADGTWEIAISTSIRDYADANNMEEYLTQRAAYFQIYSRRPVAYAAPAVATSSGLPAVEQSGETVAERPVDAASFPDTAGVAIAGIQTLRLHPVIAEASSPLFRDGHFADAVFAGTKALLQLIKDKSGQRNLDGADLVRTAFSKNDPIIAFNGRRTFTEKDEQEGLMHLFEGMVLALRNPRAHSILQDAPDRALEAIALCSFLAKRVETGKKRRRTGGKRRHGHVPSRGDRSAAQVAEGTVMLGARVSREAAGYLTLEISNLGELPLYDVRWTLINQPSTWHLTPEPEKLPEYPIKVMEPEARVGMVLMIRGPGPMSVEIELKAKTTQGSSYSRKMPITAWH
jgi:uncharacterized protein (TIGR02391 family)